MRIMKQYLKENWPLAVVTFIILLVGIMLYEGGLL